jgi:hypothetical protein
VPLILKVRTRRTLHALATSPQGKEPLSTHCGGGLTLRNSHRCDTHLEKKKSKISPVGMGHAMKMYLTQEGKTQQIMEDNISESNMFPGWGGGMLCILQ